MLEPFCCFTGRLENLRCRTSPTAIRIIESMQMLLKFSLWLACFLRSPKGKSIILLRPRFGAVKTGCCVKYVNLSALSFLPYVCMYPIRILTGARPDKAAVGRPKVSYLSYFSSWKDLLRKMKVRVAVHVGAPKTRVHRKFDQMLGNLICACRGLRNSCER